MEIWKRDLLARFVTLLQVAMEGELENQAGVMGEEGGYLCFAPSGEYVFKLRLEKEA